MKKMDLKSSNNGWQFKMDHSNHKTTGITEVVLFKSSEDVSLDDIVTLCEGTTYPPPMAKESAHWRHRSTNSADDGPDYLYVAATGGRARYTKNWKELLQLIPRDVDILKERMPINVTDDGFVKKNVLKEGVGDIVPPCAKVCIHFVGFLMGNNGSSVLEPFDSTLTPEHRPQIFKLDHGELIPGLNSAIKTMRLDEYAQILIEPTYAYGLLGAPPRIPAKTSCVFNVRLMDYIEDELDFFYKSPSESDNSEFEDMSLDNGLDAANKLRAAGISHLSTFCLQDAINSFLRGIFILEKVPTDTMEETYRCSDTLAELRLLLAKTYLKGQKPNPKKACSQCEEGLYQFTSAEISGQFNLTMAKAKFMLKDFLVALNFLTEAKELGLNDAVEDVDGFESKIRQQLRSPSVLQLGDICTSV